MTGAKPSPVGESIVFSEPSQGQLLPPPDTRHRAVHQIRLSALSHNFACVESAAARQRCSVIVVVKADGYGHSAVESAIHLADNVGADAFAVATLEEGIALRRAFESTPAKNLNGGKQQQSQPQQQVTQNLESRSQSSSVSPLNTPTQQPARSMRPNQIRILVLGPPVGFPRCFDDYYHYDIEVMCSGPEVAKALIEWISDEKERKRTQVERAANDAKAAALMQRPAARDAVVSNIKKEAPIVKHALQNIHNQQSHNGTLTSDEKKEIYASSRSGSIPGNAADVTPSTEAAQPQQPYKEPTLSATVTGTTGQDLAKEVRAFLMNQQAAKEAKEVAQPIPAIAKIGGDTGTVTTMATSTATGARHISPQTSTVSSQSTAKAQVFGGIEAVAKTSRTREMAAAKANGIFREDSGDYDSDNPKQQKQQIPQKQLVRKRLRYHILVDSGMGRLGFKTQPVEVSEVGVRRDTVEIIQELVELEVSGAPIEFFGLCTHMADANSTSTYTNDQMNRFKGLLKRVRGANISIPTVSTDNSAALLTTTLKHFDAKEILSQQHADTRGFVRTGGAIYGQRPAFKQLRAVSTLLASVRHVAILKKGESVGYDRAYVAPYNVRIATLAIGFADGYPRELGRQKGKVAIRGHLFPVCGNVCMDMMMVELGQAEDKTGPGAKIVVGDTAVLWGPYENDDGDGLVRLQDIAATLGTTQSALTCGLDKTRVLRQFV